MIHHILDFWDSFFFLVDLKKSFSLYVSHYISLLFKMSQNSWYFIFNPCKTGDNSGEVFADNYMRGLGLL